MTPALQENPSPVETQPEPAIKAPPQNPPAPLSFPATTEHHVVLGQLEPDAPHFQFQQQVKSPHWWRALATILCVTLVMIVLGLVFVPWQQSVSGSGKVVVLSPMDRPQNIEAQIPARLLEWRVVDGQRVKQGDVIAVLQDIDWKFLNPDLVDQAQRQRDALVVQRDAARTRAGKLQEQYKHLTSSRAAALPIADERAGRAADMVVAAEETLRQAEHSRDSARDAQLPAARERLLQADESRRAQQEALLAARQRLEVETLKRERVRRLFEKGLNSREDDDVAQRDLVVAQTEVGRAERSLAAADRAVNVAQMEVKRASIEADRAENDVANKVAALEAARRDSNVGQIDVKQVDANTAAQLAALEASIASAQESVGKAEELIAKLDQDLANMRLRASQQQVTAPRDGIIVRLGKVGTGATVKAGDLLAVIAPASADQAVEFFISDHDAPLVSPGKKVRLQFAGYPALQTNGWPSVALGTFGGEIISVDPVDDGRSRFRLLIKSDRERIASGADEPWPTIERLRPGAKVAGWVMLDTVSIGFELWRTFNAFPPSLERPAELSAAKNSANASHAVEEEEKKDDEESAGWSTKK